MLFNINRFKFFLKMKFTIVVLMACLSFSVQAQDFFKYFKGDPQGLRNHPDREITPDKYEVFQLDFEKLTAYLAGAPVEKPGTRSDFNITLPLPDGGLMEFTFVNSPVMASKLASKYPEIQSFKAISKDGSANARFDIGPFGFHASIRTSKGDVYIDPYTRDQKEYLIVYYLHDLKFALPGQLKCGTTSENLSDIHPARRGNIKTDKRTISQNFENLHTYRLALACTGEWGRVRGSVAQALADMNTSVNRLNLIYENEIASRLVLIDRNSELIFLDPNTDPYNSPRSGGALLGENSAAINSILAIDEYDIGHVYTMTCDDVGGIAALSSLCNDMFKARGVTCHYTNLITITVQVAAHEFGHQFSATHTFNNCGGNESGGTAFEPGSGSTIMAYGGLCGTNNVQGANDDYFHWASLNQMYNYMRTAGSRADDCAMKTEIPNTRPVPRVSHRNGLVIPRETPFYLNGTAFDAEGDNMTYNWEQINTGPQSPLGSPSADSPIFRSVRPSASTQRIIPAKASLFSSVNSINEVLPTYSRNINFAFTARDNNPAGGLAGWSFTNFTASGSAGPFIVLFPNQGNFKTGEKIEVRWDVANTNNAPVNCQFVDIYLSLNTALFEDSPNFIQLACRVPNNGSHTVTIPEVSAGGARIVVAGHDNIFFDISNANLVITTPTEPTAYFELNSCRETLCLPDKTIIGVRTKGFGGLSGNLVFDVEGMPEGMSFRINKAEINTDDNFEIEFDIENSVLSGQYPLNILCITSTGDTVSRPIVFDVISTNFDGFELVSPEDGLTGASDLPSFSWVGSPNAEEYIIRISDRPDFIGGSLNISTIVTGTSYIPATILQKSTIYYWQVIPLNQCAEGTPSPVRAFITEALNCQNFDYPGERIIIPGPVVTREAKISLPVTDGIILDLNVSKLHVRHDNFRDLRLSLVSPAGTTAVLVNRQCLGNRTLNAAFDDQAPVAFNCTLNQPAYRPQQPLSVFNGENIKGDWTLRIEDLESENGGDFFTFGLEFCTGVSLSNPSFGNVDTLKVKTGEGRIIENQLLSVMHPINGPQDIEFVVVTLPTYGRLLRNGVDLNIGDKFTQLDINSNIIRYLQSAEVDGSQITYDEFRFVVSDKAAGWLPITAFPILINDDFISNTTDVISQSLVLISPNPAADQVYVTIKDEMVKNMDYTISNLEGKLMKRGVVANGQSISTSEIPAGLYLLHFKTSNALIAKKLVIQR